MKNPGSFLPALRKALAWALVSVALASVSTSHAATQVLEFTAGAANAPIGFPGSYIVLNSRYLNGKPGLKPILTQSWTSVYNNHPVGLAYITGTSPAAGRWTIFNEDLAAISTGAQFDLLITTSVHVVNGTPLDSVGDFTAFGVAKGQPSAILLFTHMLDPYPSLGSGIFVQNQGLNYPSSSTAKNPLFNKWNIFNQVTTSPAAAAGYFVLDTASLPLSLHTVALIHTSSVANMLGNVSQIDDSGALTASTNVVFISPVGSDDNKTVGVYYSAGKWNIFNEDQTQVSPGEKFNVLMFPQPIPIF